MKRGRFSNLASSVLALTLMAAGTVAADEDSPWVLDTRSDQQHGEYLVDGAGMSLYLFKKDTQGSKKSTCHDRCAEAWPPLTSDAAPQATGAVKSELLGVIEHEDGSQQVTYNGWPLYYFIKDENPGDTRGQDVKGFGAEWYLVTPEGKPVEHAEE